MLPRDEADSLGLPYDFVAAWITLQVHSSLEAIGLTAAVSAALTEAKISCNVLAGFHHDHLLVPVADADRALEVLHELVAANGGSTRPAPELRAAQRAAGGPSRHPGPHRRGVRRLPGDRAARRRRTRGSRSCSGAVFECQEYLPAFSIVAELDGEIVGHVISTRGMGGGAGAARPRADRGGAAAAAPRHRHRAHERDRGAGQRRGGAGDRPAGQPRVLLPLRLRSVHLARGGAAGGGLGRALPAAAAGRLARRRQRHLPLRPGLSRTDPARRRDTIDRAPQ